MNVLFALRNQGIPKIRWELMIMFWCFPIKMKLLRDSLKPCTTPLAGNFQMLALILLIELFEAVESCFPETWVG